MESIDYEARKDATVALERLAAHERQCAERYTAIHDKMDEVGRKLSFSVSGLYSRLWWMIGGLVGAEALLISFLAERWK